MRNCEKHLKWIVNLMYLCFLWAVLSSNTCTWFPCIHNQCSRKCNLGNRSPCISFVSALSHSSIWSFIQETLFMMTLESSLAPVQFSIHSFDFVAPSPMAFLLGCDFFSLYHLFAETRISSTRSSTNSPIVRKENPTKSPRAPPKSDTSEGSFKIMSNKDLSVL